MHSWFVFTAAVGGVKELHFMCLKVLSFCLFQLLLTVFVHVLVWVHGRAVKFLSVLQKDQIHILDSSPIADVVDQTGCRAGILQNVISYLYLISA